MKLEYKLYSNALFICLNLLSYLETVYYTELYIKS